MADETRKRSRFDQTEAEPKRASRFDRRSRSPSRRTESRRSRSPVASSRSPQTDPAAAAAAAAARINAQLQAKKGIQHIDVPPIRASSTPGGGHSPGGATPLNGDIYQQDGDYIKDIEVNDLRNRYTLTKGATQKMIKDETGADVTTRGSYYPDKSMATPTAPPLYLHVTSTTKEGLEKAVQKINDLMQQELPNLVDERRFRRREPDPVERDELGRRKWPEERIPIDLEPIPGFNLRAQVVGHGGAYVKHIQNETRCRVQIKGRGSGFTEHGTGIESDEPMYLHVAGPDPVEVKNARTLCEDLLTSVKEQYQQFKERGGQRNLNSNNNNNYGGGSDYAAGGTSGGRYGGAHRDSPAAGGNGYYGGAGGGGTPGAVTNPPSAMSPIAGQAGANAQDYAAQYAQYYQNGQDPYAAYGGYQAYVQMYYAYYGQQQPGQDAPGTSGTPGASATPGMEGPPGMASTPSAPGSAAPPPPPPPANEAPPPPPPSGGPPGTSGYSAAGPATAWSELDDGFG